MDTIPHCQESNGDAHGLDSMRLINIKAFTEREQVMSTGGRVNRRTKIFEFCDDEVTPYAILSHRWIDSTEVDYEEMADLAKMDREEGDEIRQRLGYKKILESCEQAKRDGHAWLWVDTCCIDKRSSAELSEAINSMYRWYENSRVCYAYLHDVWGSSFPTARDDQRYFNFNGWPEWFSRGWTLQEMIAPKDVQFFNKDWQPIADKRTFANILSRITRVPEHVLQHGLSFDRPCVAQILSWAANRTTTRVEDRAYSLLGLLDVNMPMLYGEGKKAFHRLQLEIIRISNDQSVFAWGCRSRDNSRTGSILADDPSFFRGCSSMVLMDHDKFIRELRHNIPEEELPSVEDDQFGTFPITNRGIQIWLFLRPYEGSTSVFQAWLPCCSHPSGAPVTINVALWNSNYYRYSAWLSPCPTEEALHFRQVYFRYQDTYHDVTFAIDDGAIAENGFTCCDVYPSKQLTGNMLTLTGASPLCVRVYSDRESNCRFALTLGQWFGRDFIHCTCKAPTSELLLSEELNTMLVRGPERVQSMAEAPSRGECYGRVWINHTCLLGSTWIVRTSRVVWERSRIGVRMEVFRHPDFRKGPNDWRILEVEATSDPRRDIRGLMLRDTSYIREYTLRVDRDLVDFLLVHEGAKLGDYGHFADSGIFRCKGNIFTAIESLSSEADIAPGQHEVSMHSFPLLSPVTVDRLGLSLPSNHTFNSLLASLSPRLPNAYLVTRVVRCFPESSGLDANNSSSPMSLCTIAKPLVLHRDEGMLAEWSNDTSES